MERRRWVLCRNFPISTAAVCIGGYDIVKETMRNRSLFITCKKQTHMNLGDFGSE